MQQFKLHSHNGLLSNNLDTCTCVRGKYFPPHVAEVYFQLFTFIQKLVKHFSRKRIFAYDFLPTRVNYNDYNIGTGYEYDKYYVVFLVISFGPSWFDETLIKGRHILMFSEEEYMTTG